ncbi:uncharacterized protein LOC131230775 isoform X2 [Magnolia sinica]|uniref:uncharacterized protein LOC131230775 isoform X2 n=1 Tax=Magnolia sinica TaxID=86752 RepID=UPI00265A665A|nr:uncharacterized protein LOC131230775 isoform X2 [Magnolia sinica]
MTYFVVKMTETKTLTESSATISNTSDFRDSDATPDNLGVNASAELQDDMDVESSPMYDTGAIEDALLNGDDACLMFAIQQSTLLDSGGNSCNGITDEVDGFDPYLLFTSFPEVPETGPSFKPFLFPSHSQKRLPITLVLDLDETLVHSTLDYCENADFTFQVCFGNEVQTVYVRQRPYLHMFLEAVAGMFEIIVFTASQSIYAEQLLDILDPERRLICDRAYRDSCVFSESGYTKDLTILGRDLAKVAIVDNSPQVYQLQVDNGIPIQSWFGDPSDSALVSLLPFLETLAGADDVRPIIAKKFSCQD